jgi:hypothetical protein
MASLGDLTISIKANTVEFTDGAGNVVAKLRNMADESEKVGKQMTSSMREARGGLMMTEHILGVPLPRHLNTLIAQIPGVGAAFATMLPIIGVVLAISIIGKLIEKHIEHAEAIRKAKNAFEDISAEGSKSMRDLDDKVLESGKKLDELSHNHAAALAKELKLIDHKAIDELTASIDKSTASADKYFKLLKPAWYDFSSGVKNASDAMEKFKSDYEEAINENTAEGTARAGKILDETLSKAKQDLADMQTQALDVAAAEMYMAEGANDFHEATEGAVKAQAKLAELVQKVKDAKDKIDEDKDNKELAAQLEAAEKAHSEEQSIQERTLTVRKAAVDEKVKIVEDGAKKDFEAHKISSEELLAIETDSEKSRLAAERDFINGKIALENSSSDDAAVTASKVAELQSQLANKTADANAKIADLNDDAIKRASSAAEKLYSENERQAKETSAAIEESLAGEEKVREAVAKATLMQDASVLKLLESENKAAQIKIKSDAGSGAISKVKEQQELQDSLKEEEKLRKQAYDVELSDAEAASFALIAIKAKAFDGGSDEAKAKATKDLADAQAKVNSLMAQNNVLVAQNAAAIRAADVEQKRLTGDFNQWITDMKKDMPTTAKMMEQSFDKALAGMNAGLAKTIVEGKNFGQAMKQVGAQLLEAVIEQELKKVEVYLMGLLQRKAADTAGDAAKVAEATATTAVMKTLAASEAGAWAFESVMAALPFPTNVATAPEVAMSAAAQAMAFAKGGLVPGDGYSDTVPAMLTPGETVVTKALTQQVAQSQGGGSGRGHVIQHSPTYNVSTMDSRGFSAMLEKHDAEFQKHAVSTLRKLNVRAGRG